MKDGKGERRRFSSPRLSDAEHVSTVHEGRDGFGLHRGRGAVSLVIKGVQNSVVKVKVGEG